MFAMKLVVFLQATLVAAYQLVTTMLLTQMLGTALVYPLPASPLFSLLLWCYPVHTVL